LRKDYNNSIIDIEDKKFIGGIINMQKAQCPTDLGYKIKKLRLDRELTQEQVAKAMGVTPGYVSNVENNRSSMTLKMLIFYAQLTGVSLDYLAGSVDHNYKKNCQEQEILRLVRKMEAEDREKLISTLKLWVA
jgi:transcriptional regulator with XRE-family HTH domain